MAIGKKKKEEVAEIVDEVEATEAAIEDTNAGIGNCATCNGTGLIDRATLCTTCGGTGHFSEVE